ncbi:hypothetical protein STEG23_009650, partial [Scotinomys teguina]
MQNSEDLLPLTSTIILSPLFLCLMVSGLKGEGKKDRGMVLLSTTVSRNKGLKKEKYGSSLYTAESVFKREEKMVKGVEVLATTADSKQFFSVLSITSYSSFAFHKVSVAIYNISNPKTVDAVKFPTRYCYCLSNRTNDLSDFTALLVDIVGNSTSYLTEIFKSTSILSVSQNNESDCVFICVMAGKSGRTLSDFWEMVEKSPVINYTFTSGVSHALATLTAGTQTPNPTKAPAPTDTQTDAVPAEWPFTPKSEPALLPAAHQVS